MSELLDELLPIENELAAGDGGAYREHLVEEAVVVIPGRALDKAETVAAMDASPGWDEFSLGDERAVRLNEDAALLTYRFDGRRGDFGYAALMSSVYLRRDGAWRMAFHQQTPLEGHPGSD